MTSKKITKLVACVSAFAMLAGSVAPPLMNVSAIEELSETCFDYKIYPWQLHGST